MEEIGFVESINDKKNTVRVVFSRKSACDKCGMCLKSKDNMTVSVEVKNTLGARPGDRVAVAMGNSFVLKAALIVYIIPVVFVGAAILLGRGLNELVLFGIVVGALLLGLLVSVLFDKLIRNKKGYAPRLERVIMGEEDNE